MLTFKKRILFRSPTTAVYAVLGEDGSEQEVPDAFVFDAERDDPNRVSVLSCAEDGQLLYTALKVHWICMVALWVLLLAFAVVGMCFARSLLALVPLVIVTLLLGDRILSWPDNMVKDVDGNVLYVDTGRLYVPGQCTIKMV